MVYYSSVLILIVHIIGSVFYMDSIYVDFKSRKPIYEQIVENVSSLALRGVLKPNESIPSVRQLASELGINPNTIHKAYAELERRGIIYSSQGRGSFVSDDLVGASDKKRADIIGSITSALADAYVYGIDKSEILQIVENEYAENDKEGEQ